MQRLGFAKALQAERMFVDVMEDVRRGSGGGGGGGSMTNVGVAGGTKHNGQDEVVEELPNVLV